MKALLRIAAVWDTKQTGELRGDTVQFIAASSALVLNDAKRQHLSTINTNSDLSFATIQKQTYRRKQLMDQSDDNSLTALLTKRDPVRFREVVNTCTERWAEKRVQRTAWILSHVLCTTLCEHVNGLCPYGWLNEQSIAKHWFQSVRTCPYSWATGRNNTNQLGANGPYSARFFIEKQAGDFMMSSPSYGRNWSQKVPSPRCVWKGLHLVVGKGLHFVVFALSLVMKGQSILLRTWWTLCFFFPNCNFQNFGLAKMACSLLCVNLW